MKTVRILKDWDRPDIFRQTPGGGGIWGDYIFTEDDIVECDALVVLNRPLRRVRVQCPRGNRLLFMQEPPEESYRWHRKSYKYFDQVLASWDDNPWGNILNMQGALPWHVNKSYDELKALTVDHCRGKQDKLSWVTSNAISRSGHRLRMEFLDFMRAQNYDFDLYGKGFNPIEDKFDGLFPYKYSLAIENYSCNDYWTEKIVDCFLSWTIPIYWGAKNISSYFPEGSIVFLDPDDFPGSLAKIVEVISSDYWTRNIEALGRARDLVLDKYQLFPQVAELVSKSGHRELETFSIPPNYAPREKLVWRLRSRLVAIIPQSIRVFLRKIKTLVFFH